MHAFVRGSTLVQQLRVAVPFVFSYLAMPVRQMLSGVVLDCSAPIRCRSCRACRAVARSAVGDEPGLVSYVLPYVLPYLLTHVPERRKVQWGGELVTEWCPWRHYRCPAENNFPHDCPCCRAQMKIKFSGPNVVLVPVTADWFNAGPVCDVCYAGWTISMVSRNWLHEARLYARAWKRCYCGWCDESWFRRGWICEGAVQIEAAFARRGYVVRLLIELDRDLDDL